MSPATPPARKLPLAGPAAPPAAEARPATSDAVYAYDAAGRLVGITDPGGETARYRYDAAGNRLGIDRYPSSRVSVLSVVPPRAAKGRQVTVSGTGFSTTRDANLVSVGGKTATVVSATKNRLVVTVPSGASDGKVKVTVSGVAAESAEVFALAGAAPSVTRLTPVTGGAGASVTITGSRFSSTLTANVVRFNGVVAEVVSRTSTSLTVKVPPGATTGPVSVATADGQASSTPTFTVTRSVGEVESSVSTSYDDTSPPSVKVATEGNTAEVHFEGEAGDAVGFGIDASTFNDAVALRLFDPQGNQVDSVAYISDADEKADWEVGRLPVPGRYTLQLSPGAGNTGQARVTVSRAEQAAPTTPTGASSALNNTRFGQDIRSAFAGTKGRHLSLGLTDNKFTESMRVSVFAPSGVAVLDSVYVSAGRSRALGLPELPETGTYEVLVDPMYGATGSASLTLSVDVVARPAVDGASARATVSRPGQRVRASFASPDDGVIGFGFTGITLPEGVDLKLVKPEGKTSYFGSLPDATEGVAYADGLAAGTHTLIVEPDEATTGALELWFSKAVQLGTLTPNVPTLAKPARPGQQFRFAYTAKAGDGNSLLVSDSTLESARVLTLRPGEKTPVSDPVSGTTDDVDHRGPLAAGTHSIALLPGKVGGQATLTLVPDVAAGALAADGDQRTAKLTKTGQNARYTFSGTKGQPLALTVGRAPAAWELSVRQPDGTFLHSERYVAKEATSFALDVLPESGTYTVTAAPIGLETGDLTLGLSRRTVSAVKAAAPTEPVPAGRLAEVPSGPDTWRPSRTNLAGTDWLTGKPETATPTATGLRAPPGHTALTGRVLKLDGKPLPGVSVRVGARTGRTDAQGRFLLDGIADDARTLVVDGTTANTAQRSYGRFDVHIEPKAGATRELGFPVWMTPLDTRNTVRFEAPAEREVVLTTPQIPGLEVRIPKGSVVRDERGRPVTELGITAIPIDRAPFPLPKNSVVPVYFTVQPGGTYVFPEGAQVIYPNYTHEPPGTRVEFMDYDPAKRGWYVYGRGQVSADGRQVLPDATTRVWAFHGAMFNISDLIPWDMSWLKDVIDWLSGDPVDLSTGLLTDSRTDLAVGGALGTADVTRTYWQGDTRKRAFGIGRDLSYNAFLHSEKQYQEVDLYVPGGAKVHFKRTSPGTGYLDAVFEPVDTPSELRGAKIVNDKAGAWELRFRDGGVWVFPQYAPLKEIRDRYGNAVKLTRLSRDKGEITRIDAPGGRWVSLSYDTQHRVKEARDNTGRKVAYAYDSAGRLASVTDPAGKTIRYTYDGTSNRIRTAVDARGITYLTNTYDSSGRVRKQTLPEGATYDFTYTANAAKKVTAATVTQPGGTVRRVEFDASGYGVSDTQAYGTSLARRTEYERGSYHRIDAVTDPYGRRTELTYDANGHVTSAKELAGTADARTTGTAEYGGPFDQVSRATDALGNATRFVYDGKGDLRQVTDPEGRLTTFTYTPRGQVASVVDPVGVTVYGYQGGDLVSVQDAEGRVSRRTLDAAGRVTALTDEAGSRTTISWDALNQPKKVTDPLGHAIAYGYDANGNLTSVKDARDNSTTWTYDQADRPKSARDPLGAEATFAYDAAGRVKRVTDRLGKAATATYDLLGRPKEAQYGVNLAGKAESSATYTYDKADLLAKITDTRLGTSTFAYDKLDRLRSTSGPSGTVAYTYDAADRRLTMTAAGAKTAYGYDDSSILTSVTSGSQKVTFGLDAAGRERTAALPGGMLRTTDLDRSGVVKGITYAKGTTKVGDLAYTRDARGLQERLRGSLARVALPAAESGSVFGKDNRLTRFGDRSFSYDAEGQLKNDGLRTYKWDARGRLAAVTKSGQNSSFGYDALGNRIQAVIGGVKRGFLTDASNPLVEQTGSGATAATVATSGLDEFLTRTEDGKTQVYLTDALGTVVGLADPDGSVATRYTYDPYGQPTRSGKSTSNRHTFTGREADGTGLLYYRDRYYDPETGRFISQDPSGFAGGPNLYEYALSSPTTFTDPTGNNPLLLGCLGGGLIDGLLDWGSQRLSSRKVNWSQVGRSAAMGCAMGMLGAWGGAKWAMPGCGLGNSFTADTPVLMADGTRKRIADVAVGDRVLATDPETGETGAQAVTALIQGSGEKQLVDLTVAAPDGKRSTLTATSGHPFWVPATSSWTPASALTAGTWLRTSAGTLVKVAAVQRHQAAGDVFNLTVSGPHTYYVLAGQIPVLVHNCSGMKISDTVRKYIAQGQWGRAADFHWEDLVRLHTGGVSKVIDGREIDSVTDNALIQAKRSWAAVNRPKNFLSKSVRNQIKGTIERAGERGVQAEFWFKYGVHNTVRDYIEGKGGIVRIGLGG